MIKRQTISGVYPMPYLERDTHMALLHSEFTRWETKPTLCYECGEDADGCASFNDPGPDGETEWLCQACCDEDDQA